MAELEVAGAGDRGEFMGMMVDRGEYLSILFTRIELSVFASVSASARRVRILCPHPRRTDALTLA